MSMIRETWFIGAVGSAVFVVLAVFVAVVCYKRKSNEKRAMNGKFYLIFSVTVLIFLILFSSYKYKL